MFGEGKNNPNFFKKTAMSNPDSFFNHYGIERVHLLHFPSYVFPKYQNEKFSLQYLVTSFSMEN